MDDDHLIWKSHPSWRGFLPGASKWFAPTIITLIVLGLLYLVGVISTAFLVLIILLAASAIGLYCYLRIRTTVYIITKYRVIKKYGIINTQKEQARMENITNIIVTRTLPERVLGIGKVDADTANDSTNILQWWGVKKPYEIEGIIDGLRMEVFEERRGKTAYKEEE